MNERCAHRQSSPIFPPHACLDSSTELSSVAASRFRRLGSSMFTAISIGNRIWCICSRFHIQLLLDSALIMPSRRLLTQLGGTRIVTTYIVNFNSGLRSELMPRPSFLTSQLHTIKASTSLQDLFHILKSFLFLFFSKNAGILRLLCTTWLTWSCGKYKLPRYEVLHVCSVCLRETTGKLLDELMLIVDLSLGLVHDIGIPDSNQHISTARARYTC
jgi:hypothetical protein